MAFLQEEVHGQYLGSLPSRWSALVPRMGKRTQQCQRETQKCGADDRSAEKELLEDFQLADSLLDREHAVYMHGVEALREAASLSDSEQGSGGFAWVSHVELFMQSMLTALCIKETVLADWRANRRTVPPDTLRVYTHTLMVPLEVHLSDVERLILLIKQVCSS